MKRILAASLLSFGLLSASVSSAASLTNKSYSTARQAAIGAAAYTLNKAAGFRRFGTGDLRVAKAIDTKGSSQKYRIAAKDYPKALTITVKKDAPGKYRAYVPNRFVYTPATTGNQ
jgi:hypothetical protein